MKDTERQRRRIKKKYSKGAMVVLKNSRAWPSLGGRLAEVVGYGRLSNQIRVLPLGRKTPQTWAAAWWRVL